MAKIRSLVIALLVLCSCLFTTAHINPLNVKASAAQENMYVKEKCYTYNTPYKGHEKVAMLYAGDKVSIVTETQYYYKLDNGTYVIKTHLDSKCTRWTYYKYSNPITVYTTQNAHFLDKALTDGKKIASVNKGKALTAIGYTNTGYYKLSNNYYIKMSYASKNKEKPNPASDFKYEKVNGGIKITEYIGSDLTVVIPERIDGLPVVEIGGRANKNSAVFAKKQWQPSEWGGMEHVAGDALITSVVIPETVKTIGFYAFANCKKLKSINIPASVTEIEQGAFQNCTALTSIRIPNNVTSLGSFAFSGCTELLSVTLPDNITRLSGAFSGCSKLKEVNIPKSLTCINLNSFSGCDNITSITLPAGVAEISGIAGHCDGLAEINVSESNKYYKSIDGVLFTKDGTKMLEYPPAKKGTSYTMPNGVVEIQMYAFADCQNLQHISLPKTVTKIWENAFDSDTIKTVTRNGRTYTADGKEVWERIDFLYNIILVWGD